MWAGNNKRRLPMLLNGPDNCQNCSFPLGYMDPHLTHGSLDRHESASQKWHLDLVQPFLQGSQTWPTDKHIDRLIHTQTHFVLGPRWHTVKPFMPALKAGKLHMQNYFGTFYFGEFKPHNSSTTYYTNKIATYGTGGRLLLTANFKVT